MGTFEPWKLRGQGGIAYTPLRSGQFSGLEGAELVIKGRTHPLPCVLIALGQRTYRRNNVAEYCISRRFEWGHCSPYQEGPRGVRHAPNLDALWFYYKHHQSRQPTSTARFLRGLDLDRPICVHPALPWQSAGHLRLPPTRPTAVQPNSVVDLYQPVQPVP